MVRSESKQTQIDAYDHDADDSGTDLCPWPRDGAASRQDVSTPFSILIKFEATEYSYSIWYSIWNLVDIWFDLNEIPDSSLVDMEWEVIMAGGCNHGWGM